MNVYSEANKKTVLLQGGPRSGELAEICGLFGPEVLSALSPDIYVPATSVARSSVYKLASEVASTVPGDRIEEVHDWLQKENKAITGARPLPYTSPRGILPHQLVACRWLFRQGALKTA